MKELIDLLVDTDVLESFDFDDYMDIIAIIYENRKDKRKDIIKALKNLSEYTNLTVGDAIRSSMSIAKDELEEKHIYQIIKYYEVGGVRRKLIYDPFVTIVTNFYENFCPRPDIDLIKETFF